MGRIILLIFFIGLSGHSFSQAGMDSLPLSKMDSEVSRLMTKGNIPGLSLVIIDGDTQLIRAYGYADKRTGRPVTSHTLFQLGSCSKAFTALAVERLAQAVIIDLDAYVADYLPWFRPTYKDTVAKMTVLQVLHHTSGISWQTLSSIAPDTSADALEKTIRKIAGIPLRNAPGWKFEYATVNYDILALLIQTLTHEPFEEYVQDSVLNRLQLSHTSIGSPDDSRLLATGYKIGFFQAREYDAPVYKGNNAAGYVISDAGDMTRWLRFQLGLDGSALYDAAKATQQRDETVGLHGMDSYAMGWEVSLSGNGEIFHGGINPNYTSYIVLRPARKLGIAVLTNSSSSYTPVIGERLMRLLAGEKAGRLYAVDDGNDRVYSVGSIAVAIYILGFLGFLTVMVKEIAEGKRVKATLRVKEGKTLFLSAVCILPFLFGIYVLPKAMAGFSWGSALVWSPVSFGVLIVSILAAIFLSYLAGFFSLLFPAKNKFKRAIPRMLLMSMLSGTANMMVIILVSSALQSGVRLRYLVFYYILALSVYLLGRRFVQRSLFQFSRDLISELRVRLLSKIFSTSYQKFEKLDRGRIYGTLNNDVETIGGSGDQLIMLVSNLFTTVVAFLFLSSIAFWATMVIIALVVSISVLYYLVSRSANLLYTTANVSRNDFIRHMNGMIDGFKELSLRRKRKLEYRADVVEASDTYNEKMYRANIRFVNAFLAGESSLVILLGVVAFAIPRLFPGIETYAITSFVIVLLYLIGPINGVLNAVPSIMRVKLAWDRIQKFLADIPANLDLEETVSRVPARLKSIRAQGISFSYKDSDEKEVFAVGPIDLEIRSGEILFIIGGNGSGKTTLAKLLTGLYKADEGQIFIDETVVEDGHLGEYYSAVFSPLHLFEKLYDIDSKNKEEEIGRYLKLLHLDTKISIKDNKYSTIDLSGGQRKRLALLQCYLEDSPIYLFDEWAADQDPEYRNFFYRTLLPQMRKAGKIVIAITHDDHYFDAADKVLKMNQGKLETFNVEDRSGHRDAALLPVEYLFSEK